MNGRDQSRMMAGAVLILLGVGLLALQFVEGAGAALVLFLIGGLFTTGYLYTRAYGLLIPGGILMGLGLGEVGQSTGIGIGDFDAIGLGLGFLSIFVIAFAYQRRSHWWPLIPGAVLLIGGLAEASPALDRLVSVGWPLILVFVGLVLLAGAYGLTGRRPTAD
ncbi:MAG: hypothetical protein ACE5NC_03970 [Anaerolineae bacterium]